MKNPLQNLGNRMLSGAADFAGRKLREVMPGYTAPQEPSQLPRRAPPSAPKLPRIGKPML